jgi:hypothetical protein
MRQPWSDKSNFADLNSYGALYYPPPLYICFLHHVSICDIFAFHGPTNAVWGGSGGRVWLFGGRGRWRRTSRGEVFDMAGTTATSGNPRDISAKWLPRPSDLPIPGRPLAATASGPMVVAFSRFGILLSRVPLIAYARCVVTVRFVGPKNKRGDPQHCAAGDHIDIVSCAAVLELGGRPLAPSRKWLSGAAPWEHMRKIERITLHSQFELLF